MATPIITRIGGMPRQQGLQIPNVLAPARWTDSFSLVQNVAETYTLPTDATGQKASFLRIASTGTTYLRWDGAASVPAADILDGTSSFVQAANFLRFYAAPNRAFTLSLLTNNPTGAAVTIEAWS